MSKPTNILGMSAYYHDSAACLVRDGEIIATPSEERFTRRKDDSAFPAEAVEYCLAESGLLHRHPTSSGSTTGWLLKFDRILDTYLDVASRGFGQFLLAGPLGDYAGPPRKQESTPWVITYHVSRITIFPEGAMRYESLLLIAVALAPMARAQDTTATAPDSSALFANDEVVTFRLTTNLRSLFKDRGSKRPYRSAMISYSDPAGKAVSIPLKVRTRGIYRLKNCAFPPIRMNFGKGVAAGTIFAGEDKPKVATHCQDDHLYEQNLLQEYLLYKAYSLLTPMGHRVRLARDLR